MTTTVASPEEICNIALGMCRYPALIGDMMEGTKHANIALRFYSQTRDALLIDGEWDFARQAAVLSLLKTAPVGGYGLTPWSAAYPPPPWIYEYAYPANALDVRSVRPTPIGIPELAPQPNIFVVGNDSATNQKVILTNLAAATCVFTAQVVDITQWDAVFVETLVARLAKKFAYAFAEADAVRALSADEGQDQDTAEHRPG